MKVVVTEIDKDDLLRIINIYNLESQISFKEETQLQDKDNDIKIKPYYIDENIVDFEKLFSLRGNEADLITPSDWLLNMRDFENFWTLILKIHRLRKFDGHISDVEYVYKKGIELNLQIELKRASPELGFYPDLNYFVITGESKLGNMLLYQDEGEMEFVFSIEYCKTSCFTKKKRIASTHWHPSDYIEAIKDMVAFMNNEKEHFKVVGLNLK